MKFGKILIENIEKEYEKYYIPYNDIKKNINLKPESFSNILFHYIDISDNFYKTNKNKNLTNFALLNVFSILKVTKKYIKKNNDNLILNNIKKKLNNITFFKDLLNEKIIRNNDKQNKCNICYENNYLLKLNCCGQSICWSCSLKCYLNQFNKCNYCRREINVNPILIKLENLTSTKNNFYNQFCKNSRKLLVIGIDGLRPDAFLYANTPNFNKLIQNSSFNFETIIESDTISGPSWATIFSGKLQKETNIYFNEDVEDNKFIWKTNDIFSDINKLNIDTYSFANNWIGMKNMIQNSKNIKYVSNEDCFKSDKEIIEYTNNHILSVNNDNFTFMYLNGIDDYGHKYGFSIQSEEYVNYIEKIDAIIEDLLNNSVKNNWSIMIVTDHGGCVKSDLEDKLTTIFDSIENTSGQNKKKCKGIHGLDIPQHKRTFKIYHGEIIKNKNKEIVKTLKSSDTYNEVISFFNQ